MGLHRSCAADHNERRLHRFWLQIFIWARFEFPRTPRAAEIIDLALMFHRRFRIRRINGHPADGIFRESGRRCAHLSKQNPKSQISQQFARPVKNSERPSLCELLLIDSPPVNYDSRLTRPLPMPVLYNCVRFELHDVRCLLYLNSGGTYRE